ncbi:MAG: bifunctional N-acetylglucosamine-1-phosphate uridyltransferase/glucosamine-1-phosphate acetyltransferase [Thermoleophilia bacterium]
MSSFISSVVVLAAGQGKRMKSELPKVLHQVCGRPMLLHVLAATRTVAALRTVVVLGHGYEQVLPYLPADCVVARQEDQRGTGHAVLAAAEHILEGDVLVLPGDTPLVTAEALEALVREHKESHSVATVLTMMMDDPSGYGRIVRFPDGSVARIVEHRDADEDERAIREVNSGMLILPVPLALDILATLGTDNDQGEIYLTDVVAGLRQRGERVGAAIVADPRLVLGVNSRVELAQAEALLGERIKARWMRDGVTIIDPASTIIEAEVTIEPDVIVRPFTVLAGETTVAKGSDIGPSSTLIDARIGEECVLPHCYVRSTAVETGARLRPFTSLDGSPEKPS